MAPRYVICVWCPPALWSCLALSAVRTAQTTVAARRAHVYLSIYIGKYSIAHAWSGMCDASVFVDAFAHAAPTDGMCVYVCVMTARPSLSEYKVELCS